MVNEELRVRITKIINAGLVRGLGSGHPGATCVEGAIALAMGEVYSDMPSCVAPPDRVFAIRLNDARWSSPAARARGLLPVALAQVGTAGTDRGMWAAQLERGMIQCVVPMMLRDIAMLMPSHSVTLKLVADRCACEGNRSALDEATSVAYDIYRTKQAPISVSILIEAEKLFRAGTALVDQANKPEGLNGLVQASWAGYIIFHAVVSTGDRDALYLAAANVALDAYRAEADIQFHLEKARKANNPLVPEKK